MVADFMRDDVTEGRIACRTEFGAHLFVERQIEVNLFIGRAVKRPHRRLTHTAGGACAAGIQYQSGGRIAGIAFGKVIGPGFFRIGQHHARQFPQLCFLLAFHDGLLCSAAQLLRSAGQAGQIDAVVRTY